MKRCTKCGEEKAEGEFYKDKSKRDGLMTKCKVCYKAYAEAHREERRKYHQRRYHENREERRRKGKAYYAANREKYAARHREYYRTHREQVRATQDKYRHTKRGRETVRILREQHRARQLGVAGELTRGQWEILRLAFRSCPYCGLKFGRGRRQRTLDHVIPFSRGGTHELGNVLPVCSRCNYSKKDRMLGEWVPPLLRKKNDARLRRGSH